MWDWLLSIFMAILAFFGFNYYADLGGCAGAILPSSAPPPKQSSEIKLLASSYEPDVEKVRAGAKLTFRARTSRPTTEAQPVVYIRPLGDPYNPGGRLAVLNDAGEQGDLAAGDGNWAVQIPLPRQYSPGNYRLYLVLEYNNGEYSARFGFDANIEITE